MRKRIGFTLIIVSVIMAVVACQPDNWWEDYWWPDKMPEKPGDPVLEIVSEKEVVSEFLRTFNPGQALKDAADKSRDDIYYEDHDAGYVPASSGLNARAATSVRGMIYRYVFFDGYRQSSLGLIYNDGYMVFAIDADTVSTGNVAYTVSATEGIEIKTQAGQVVEDVKLAETTAMTDAITAITKDEAGNITIEIDDTTSMELPPSASASSPELGNDIIMKAEEETSADETDKADIVVDSFSISEILYLFDDIGETPAGVQLILNDTASGGTHVSIQFDNAEISNAVITGTIDFDFTKDHGVFRAFKASTPSFILVNPDGSDNWNRVNFDSLDGICDIEPINPYVKLNVGYVWQDEASTININGESVSYKEIEGDGSEGNPYLIDSGNKLRLLADYYRLSEQDTSGLHFTLSDDIDVAGLFNGVAFDDFEGVFDGNGYTITGLEGSLATNCYGTIKNVKLADVSYPALVKNLYGTIENTEILSGEIDEKNEAAGFALVAGGNASIKNVSNHAAINGKKAGGIVAVIRNADSFTLSNAANYGNVTATLDAGGIIGIAESFAGTFAIEGAVNEGNISETGDAAGGIIGSISGSGTAVINNAENRGDVSGAYYAGGIIGYGNKPTDFINVKNAGNVTGSDYAAGIIGYSLSACTVVGALNTGAINGDCSSGIANVNSSDVLTIKAAASTGSSADYGIGFSKRSVVSCTTCYYDSAEKGAANNSTVIADGITKVENSAWEEPVAAMNTALDEAGKDFEFSYAGGVLSLPEVTVEITMPSV